MEEEEEIEETVAEEPLGEHVEEESILSEYDPDDFVSGAVTSPYSTIPFDLFEFEYPFCNNYRCDLTSVTILLQ